jgi:phospholipid-translocating ATPase
MAVQPSQEENEVTNPVKRIRWATHRAKGPKADNKRQSLKERLHRRIGSTEKKRDSLGKEAGPLENGDVDGSEADSEEQDSGRRVYFGLSLPQQERDENGHPIAHYARNKIRTAKYTALSFIPKNLYFQFHNIANMYFLFIIILGVCCAPVPSSSFAFLYANVDHP